MYGVSESLPLKEFVGQECVQIGLGEFQVQFNFSDGSSINVEGKWELSNRDNVLVDEFISHSSREKYCVHQIIGQKVCSFFINVPLSFTLHFENQFTLTIYDDSEHYESFYLYSSRGCNTHV